MGTTREGKNEKKMEEEIVSRHIEGNEKRKKQFDLMRF
jgi:hypothetical protein